MKKFFVIFSVFVFSSVTFAASKARIPPVTPNMPTLVVLANLPNAGQTALTRAHPGSPIETQSRKGVPVTVGVVREFQSKGFSCKEYQLSYMNVQKNGTTCFNGEVWSFPKLSKEQQALIKREAKRWANRQQGGEPKSASEPPHRQKVAKQSERKRDERDSRSSEPRGPEKQRKHKRHDTENRSALAKIPQERFQRYLGYLRPGESTVLETRDGEKIRLAALEGGHSTGCRRYRLTVAQSGASKRFRACRHEASGSWRVGAEASQKNRKLARESQKCEIFPVRRQGGEFTSVKASALVVDKPRGCARQTLVGTYDARSVETDQRVAYQLHRENRVTGPRCMSGCE